MNIGQTQSAVQQRVVILGGGFAGLSAAQALKQSNARVTVVDRNNYHLFQPLLYQVATAGLSPADVATPLRSALKGQDNTHVVMDNVTGIDSLNKTVKLDGQNLPYDKLIVATGAVNNYFGHPEWEKFAPGLKGVGDAIVIRNKILSAFERAESEPNEELRKEWLNFVIVGGGATGVELAGAVAELSRRTFAGDFKNIRPADAKIVLLNAGPRILAGFSEETSAKAEQALKDLGVDVINNARVQNITADQVEYNNQILKSRTSIWGAGVKSTPVPEWLGVAADKAGRVSVNEFCQVSGLKDVYVLGDAATFMVDGKPLPGLAAVAKQQGQYVGHRIAQQIAGGDSDEPFVYKDHGAMAVVGRSYAVAEAGKMKSAGRLTWLTWWLAHIAYLPQARNQLSVFANWVWSYLTYGKGARLITGEK